MWHWGGTLVWGRSWCWAAGDTESSKRRNTSNAITPGASTAPLGNQLCLPELSSNIGLEPGIFLNIVLHSLRRYTALEHREDKKCANAPVNFSLDPIAGIDCQQKPPAGQSAPGFVFVGRKKDLFSLPQCLHFSACFCQTALVLQVGQCYASTFSEILSIYGYPDEVVKYDGKCNLSKAVFCDTCVLCSPCPQWRQAVIVRSCDFRGWWCYSLVLEDCQW